MKFTMNNRNWNIKEVNYNEFNEITKDDNYYFGLTIRDNQEIWINKDLCKEQKRQTLMHELLHCYIGCYCSFEDITWNEDIICNICANSHDIIHKIIEDYFK